MPNFNNLSQDREDYINSMVFQSSTTNAADYNPYEYKQYHSLTVKDNNVRKPGRLRHNTFNAKISNPQWELSLLEKHMPSLEYQMPVMKKKPCPPHAAVDNNTLQPFQKVVPFDLLHKPKEGLVTDLDRESAQWSRPRLALSPQLFIDDIEDSKARSLVCRELYSTTYRSQCADIPVPGVRVAAPLPDLPAPSHPIVLPRLRPPELQEEWRKDAIAWDNEQPRFTLDLEKRFWTESDVYAKCVACKQTAQVRKRNSMLKNHMT